MRRKHGDVTRPASLSPAHCHPSKPSGECSNCARMRPGIGALRRVVQIIDASTVRGRYCELWIAT